VCEFCQFEAKVARARETTRKAEADLVFELSRGQQSDLLLDNDLSI